MKYIIRQNFRVLQRGQSMTEVLAISLALVPMFIAIPLLGSYLDMNQSAEAASRYVAFEATVHNGSSIYGWKNDATLANEVRRRFFSTSDAPIKTGDVAGNFAGHQNPLWTDVKGKPLLPDFNANVTVSTKRDSKNILAGAVFASAFNLPSDNFYHATVSVLPKNFDGLKPFDTLNLNITRKSSLVVDTWAANSPTKVASTIENAGILAYPIQPLKLLGATLGQMPSIVFDPTMNVGKVNPEIVPCDRLEPAC
jgi:hypothetical protein